eukprot:TRINITY_DN17118_c0_g1_i1.p1 TRINITY_DN17118_c0_g1~~TRINITY_DN17118_c0_g1_i1.p1  ORF type:complete len:1066 (-),score=254.99 TRINITY_DN17118_c0_g1_i1:663-3422(-)
MTLFLPSHRVNTVESLKIESFNISINLDKEIGQVVSENHIAQFLPNENNHGGTVVTQFDTSKFCSNYVLNIPILDTNSVSVSSEVDESRELNTVSISFVPPKSAFGSNDNEIIFLLDRSSSMDNSRLLYVLDTVGTLLDNLPPTTLFNIASFGNNSSYLFPKSMPLNSANIAQTKNYLPTLNGDLGKTELFPTLIQFQSYPFQQSYQSHIFLFTDGEIASPEKCLIEASRLSPRTRLSTFGITGKDKKAINLINSLSRRGRGISAIVLEEEGELLKNKVIDQLHKILVPSIVRWELNWGVPGTLHAPYHVPSLIYGEEFLVTAIIPSSKPTTLNIKGFASENTEPYIVDVEITPSIKTNRYSNLYTSENLILDWENRRSPLHDQNGVVIDSDLGNSKAIKEHYLNYAKTHGLATRLSERILQAKNGTSLLSSGGGFGGYLQERDFGLEVVVEKSHWHTETPLERMLKEGEFTLEQILNENDVISECQVQGEAIVRFFQKEHVCVKLFKYICSPENPKFQKVSTDIAAQPIWSDPPAFLFTQQCIGSLLDVFSLPSNEIPTPLISSVCTIIKKILPSYRLIDYMIERDHLLDHLFEHIKSPYVLDMVSYMLKFENKTLLNWILGYPLVIKCIQQSKEDNSMTLLLNLVSIPKLSETKFPHKEFITEIFNALSQNPNHPRADSLLSLLSTFVTRNIILPLNPPPLRGKSVPPYQFSIHSFSTSQSNSSPKISIEKVHNVFVSSLPLLLQLLQTKRYRYESTVQICGRTSIVIINLLECLVRCNMRVLNEGMLEARLFNHIFDLFFQFPKNNALHAAVVEIVESVLLFWEEDLKNRFLKESDIVERIMDGLVVARETVNGRCIGSCAFGGHLMRMAYYISLQKGEVVAFLEENNRWKEFLQLEGESLISFKPIAHWNGLRDL